MPLTTRQKARYVAAMPPTEPPDEGGGPEGLMAPPADKPNADATKAQLAAWLDARGISYPSDATKAELRQIVDDA